MPFPMAKRFPRIVISSEREKSFSFAVRKSCEGSGKRETCFMRLGSTASHADGFTKENGNGERKRSLGCARDDETGVAHLTLFFNPAAEANLRPFLWKGDAQRAGGWLPFLRRSRLLLAFPLTMKTSRD